MKKCLTVFICILMCPRRSYPSKSNGSHETRMDPHQKKPQPSQWVAGTVDGDKYRVAALAEAEPGFALTKEEKKKFKLWPGRVIPYFIDKVSFDEKFRDMLRSFLAKSGSLTGLHFFEMQSVPENAVRYVFFVNRRGVLDCQDYTTADFTNQGIQKVVIGYNCFSDGQGPGSLILALAGVPPMHRAPNRDEYVTFTKKNLISDKEHLYDVLDDKDWLFHDTAYDWQSAGHYTWHKYTTNGHATLAPKKEAPLRTGEFKTLSYVDVWKIKMLYNYSPRKGRPENKSQCKKLFMPGSNFTAYSPQSDEELTPRKKPNKYLGIPDAAPEKPGNDDKQDEDDKPDETEINEFRPTEIGSKSKLTNYFHHKHQLTTHHNKGFLSGSDFGSSERENKLVPIANRQFL